MAVPAHVNRVTPAHRMLEDGFSTLITLANNPDIAFYEKETTPPGVDGGDKIDQTTMHNILWRTSKPRSLQEMTDTSTTVAYDPLTYNEILAEININQGITVTFSDGSQLSFWGFLRSFIPNSHVEGEQPTAEVVISASNYDDDNCVEAGYLLTATGTCP